MAQQQRQRQNQRLKLTPQQILAVKLIGMPAVEIEECIKNELDDNPVLEEGVDRIDDDGIDDDSSDLSDDLTLGDYVSEDDIPDYKLAEMSNREERREITPFNYEQSLADYLVQQLQMSDLSERDKKTGEYLIGNLDDDGYLRRNLSAIADDVAIRSGDEVSDDELLAVLLRIQDFDPPGVAARDLRECLLLQLAKRRETPAVALAIAVLTDYFDDFSRKHFDKIKKNLNVDDLQIADAIREITSLNPKPGANWDDAMTAHLNRITPDFTVETLNGEITMTLNTRGVPDLRVNREYAEMLEDYVGNKANQTSDMRDAIVFVKQKIDAAQNFIGAIRQRQQTLQRIMETIIRLQTDFFLTGDESQLQPMILKDVADRTGYDISTVSRVSASKYAQTNFGLFPLKFFFSEAAQTGSGQTVSTRMLKKVLREAVAAEDKRRPLTDDELTSIMREKGFLVARRTVAKYREQLGLPVARMRKTVG